MDAPTARLALCEPLGYLDFLNLMAGAAVVLTDSGGIQEETTALGVPCLTLRDNTERPVTIEEGTNILAGTTRESILRAWAELEANPRQGRIPALWDGQAAARCRARCGSSSRYHRGVPGSTTRVIPMLDLRAQHQQVRAEVMAAIERLLDSQMFILGAEVGELECALAGYCHTAHAVGCASGTDALILALRALDIGPGDEVITVPFTFYASASAIALDRRAAGVYRHPAGHVQHGSGGAARGFAPSSPGEGRDARTPVRRLRRHGCDQGAGGGVRRGGCGGRGAGDRGRIRGTARGFAGRDRVFQLLSHEEPRRRR
jgi:hypothetical protein